MATYEYQCPDGHLTELVQAMSAPTPEVTECEACSLRAQRVFTPPAAIHFRGPGFYSTDVKGRAGRRRRPNAGDDLYRGNDESADTIAKAI